MEAAIVTFSEEKRIPQMKIASIHREIFYYLPMDNYINRATMSNLGAFSRNMMQTMEWRAIISFIWQLRRAFMKHISLNLAGSGL